MENGLNFANGVLFPCLEIGVCSEILELQATTKGLTPMSQLKQSSVLVEYKSEWFIIPFILSKAVGSAVQCGSEIKELRKEAKNVRDWLALGIS